MDDADGALGFDFKGGLDAGAAALGASILDVVQPHYRCGERSGPGDGPSRRTFRQTVCFHWLLSLCMKGDACGFLHQYDKSRMPVCRFFRLYGECREQDCVYKHTNED